MEKLKDEVWRRATGDAVRDREGGRGLFGEDVEAGDTEKTTGTYYIELIPRPFKSPFTPFISFFQFPPPPFVYPRRSKSKSAKTAQLMMFFLMIKKIPFFKQVFYKFFFFGFMINFQKILSQFEKRGHENK